MNDFEPFPKIGRWSRNVTVTEKIDGTNAQVLVKLGHGRHFGEWWGQGIQRNYGLKEKRFSLFNVNRFREGRDTLPACCHVVPMLHEGSMHGTWLGDVLEKLQRDGSQAAPGFMKPEGIVVYHSGTRTMFKKTFEKDDTGKEAA